MTKLLFTRKADLDLDEIWRFAADDSIVAADRLLGRIETAIHRLLDHPLIGQACPDIAPDLRRTVVGEYVIYYRVKSKTLLIVRILHGARDTARQSFDE